MGVRKTGRLGYMTQYGPVCPVGFSRLDLQQALGQRHPAQDFQDRRLRLRPVALPDFGQ